VTRASLLLSAGLQSPPRVAAPLAVARRCCTCRGRSSWVQRHQVLRVGWGLLSAGVCWPVRGSGGGVISSALLLAGAEFGELASHPALKYGELLLAGTLAVHLSGRAAPTNCQGRKQPGVPVVHAGMPVSDRLRTYPHFVAYFDTRLRNPKWTLEHISDATLRGGTGRR
jgi:hypothetical protein